MIRDAMFAVFEKGTTKGNISLFCEFLTISSDIFLFSPCGSNVSKVLFQNVSRSNLIFLLSSLVFNIGTCSIGVSVNLSMLYLLNLISDLSWCMARCKFKAESLL